MINRRSGQNKGCRRSDGFALVIALVLMAFLLTLLVCLGTVGRIELNRAIAQRQVALARQQAFYALGLALGQLQDSAGPDRRATARAEILGPSGVVDPFWTGVWDYTGDRPEVHWLVTTDPESESRPHPCEPPGPYVRMVGEQAVGADPRSWVEVPLISIKAPDASGEQVEIGRIGWWTGDEGVKASIQSLDTVQYLGLTDQESQQLRQIANPGASWRKWFSVDSMIWKLSEGEWLDLLCTEQVTSRFDEDTQADFAARFHDLTLVSYGLLTNPMDGGLKLNLLSPEVSDGGGLFDDVFSTGKALSVWRDYPQPDAEGIVAMRPIDQGTYDLLEWGEPYVQVAPVMSECALYLSVFHYNFSGRVGPAMRYYIDAEFWNPYTFDLQLVENGDRRALTVELFGLPEIQVKNLSNGMAIGPFSVDDSFRADGLSNTASWMEFGAPTGRPSRGKSVVLGAGEVYQLQEPDPLVQPRGLIKYADQFLAVEDEHSILVSGSPPKPDSGIDFVVTQGFEPSGNQVFRVSGVPYDVFHFPFFPPLSSSSPPYIIHSTKVNVAEMYVMAFHYGIGLSKSWRMGADWLWSFDFRRPSIDYRDGWIDANGERRSMSDLIRMANSNPVLVSSNLSELFPGNEVLFDRAPRSSGWNEYGDVRLYDLPVGEPVSIADFRILPFKGYPPLSLGSNYAAACDLNLAFDRYCLISNPIERASLWSGRICDDGLLNSRLHFDLTHHAGSRSGWNEWSGPEAGEFFVFRGAFNWNSTSIAAWYVHLIQAFDGDRGWQYTDAVGEVRNGVSASMIFRHTRGARHRQEPICDLDLPGLEDDAIRFASFRQGARFLHRPMRSFDQIRAEEDPLYRLATAIVNELKGRGEPFPALSALLNDGLLQRAIDASGLNDGWLDHAVGSVRQGDLVALLGLAPTTRSDTFVIRTMGQVINPSTGAIEGEARLEAHVQRTIEFVDESRLPNARLGQIDHGAADARRFKIVSLRWLNNPDAI